MLSSLAIFLTLSIIVVKLSQGEVTLRVHIRPPMVALECLIINTAQKASVFLNCPDDIMCFKNCERMCDKDCYKNNITCLESAIGNGMMFTYTFNTLNVKNQGEWTCHFGTQQSSTVIFFNETVHKNPLSGNTSTTAPATPISALPIEISQTLNSVQLTTWTKRDRKLVSETNVIILLVVFVISVSVNVYFVARCICCKLSPKSSVPWSYERKSCFLTMCIKFFCVEKLYKKKSTRSSHKSTKQMALRQMSNNEYEFSASTQNPPAVLLDNYAFMSTPTNNRMVTPCMFVRSQSFPSKSVDQRLDRIVGPNAIFTNTTTGFPFSPLLPSHERVSQIIYDDVPEQSISYMPHNYVERTMRPSQYINLNGTLSRLVTPTAMSMSNLASTCYRIPDMAQHPEDPNEEASLKDAISSRVELSKEMISQADSLLRRADSLLNDKEEQINTSS